MNKKFDVFEETGKGWIFKVFKIFQKVNPKKGPREFEIKEVGRPLEKWVYKPDIDFAQQHILLKLRVLEF